MQLRSLQRAAVTAVSASGLAAGRGAVIASQLTGFKNRRNLLVGAAMFAIVCLVFYAVGPSLVLHSALDQASGDQWERAGLRRPQDRMRSHGQFWNPQPGGEESRERGVSPSVASSKLPMVDTSSTTRCYRANSPAKSVWNIGSTNSAAKAQLHGWSADSATDAQSDIVLAPFASFLRRLVKKSVVSELLSLLPGELSRREADRVVTLTLQDTDGFVIRSLAWSTSSPSNSEAPRIRSVDLVLPPPYLTDTSAKWLEGENVSSALSIPQLEHLAETHPRQQLQHIRYAKAALNSFSVPHPSTLGNISARLQMLKRYLTLSVMSIATDAALLKRYDELFRAGHPAAPADVSRRDVAKRRFVTTLGSFVASIVSQWSTTMVSILETATLTEREVLAAATIGLLARTLHMKEATVVADAPYEILFTSNACRTHRHALLCGVVSVFSRIRVDTLACEVDGWLHGLSANAKSVPLGAIATQLKRGDTASSNVAMDDVSFDQLRKDVDETCRVGSLYRGRRMSFKWEDLYAPFEPRLRCTAMWRECEHPDACRYSCNMEYLLNAGVQDSFATDIPIEDQSKQHRVYRHVMLGSGSNNDFMWERNLVRVFGVRRRPLLPHMRSGSRNGIAFLGTMDCTLRDAPCAEFSAVGRRRCFLERQWMPPGFLTGRHSNSPEDDAVDVSWVQGSVCLGAHPSAAVITWASLKPMLAQPLAHVPLVSYEGAPHNDSIVVALPLGGTTAKAPSVLLNSDVRWYPRSAAEASQPQSNHRADDLKDRSDLFDDVSLLKIDIEEGEYRALGEWLRAKLSGASVLSVSQLQLEVHRTNSKLGSTPEQFSKSLWWIEYLRWELAALGFSIVSREKNHFGRRCYEWVLVHHTFYVRSESWMMAMLAEV